VGAKAAEFNIDPDRMGLMGDSAGGYLAAMVALAGDWFTVADRDGVNAAAPATVKAVVGFYGIYDMLAQWQQDMKVSPGDSITEDFLGVSPSRNRQLYLESSPIAYAASDRNQVRFLLIHGDRDNLVDPRSQSGAFTTALTKSGFYRASDHDSRRGPLLGFESLRTRSAQLWRNRGARDIGIPRQLAVSYQQ
jgi:acetyl esterase/lipase